MSFPDRNVAASAYKRCPSWTGYRALPSSGFETLALSSAAELVGVARPRCGGSVTRESDISNGENGDISIGGLQPTPRRSAIMERFRSPSGEETQRQERGRNRPTTSSPAYKVCDMCGRPLRS